MAKGLSKEQAGRILEDLQTIALVNKATKEAIEIGNKDHLKTMNLLMTQVLDGLGGDVRGMLNGNNKEKETEP